MLKNFPNSNFFCPHKSAKNLNNYFPYKSNQKSKKNYKFNDLNPIHSERNINIINKTRNFKTPDRDNNSKKISNSYINLNSVNIPNSLRNPKKTESFFSSQVNTNSLLNSVRYISSPLLSEHNINNINYTNKKTLILDLDETLVHSAFYPFQKKSDIILKINIDGKNHIIHVLKRPGLDYFLEKISALFNIIIFTASLQQYAEPLINILDKENMFKNIAELARDKVVEGITSMVDESNMNGIRIVIEVRKDVQPEVLLNHLYQKTALQVTFGVNMLALIDNVPQVLNIKQVLQAYIDHQITIVRRRSQYDLNKALDRAHILEGLRIALDHIDEIISIIRNSENDDVAMGLLMEKFGLSEVQAKSIMDMQLRRLTGLQRKKIEDEYSQLMITIADLRDILTRHERVLDIIKDELAEMKEKYNDKRRTEIVDAESDIDDEDLIPVENVMITITTNGYIKRTTVDTYKIQNRGGKGVKGMTLNSDDIVDQALTMCSHDDLLLFTNVGKVYRIRGFKVPSSNRISKGVPVINLLNMQQNEKVKAMIDVTAGPELEEKFMFFVTKQGLVKRVPMGEFLSIRQSGKIAISLRDDDELFGAMVTNGHDEIIIAGDNGKAIRFNEDDVRPMGRNASGVKGFNPDGGTVVGTSTDKMGQYILSVTQKGYGKKTPIDEYRITKRGAKGVTTININEKNGKLISMKAVNGDEDILIMTDSGTTIRISLNTVSTYGRNTKGVKMINVSDNANVATVAIIDKTEEETEETTVENQGE